VNQKTAQKLEANIRLSLRRSIISLPFADVGTCRTVTKENTGGGSGAGGSAGVRLGISICALQLAQLTVIPAPVSSTARCCPQRGQLKRMSMLGTVRVKRRAEDREFIGPLAPLNQNVQYVLRKAKAEVHWYFLS
jgi:hypothetical protein